MNACIIKGVAREFASGNRAAVAPNPGWMKTDMGGSNAEDGFVAEWQVF